MVIMIVKFSALETCMGTQNIGSVIRIHTKLIMVVKNQMGRGGGGFTVCIMSIPGTLLHMQCNAHYQKTTVANI